MGAFVLLGLGGAALSCSLVVETSSKQCSQDSDCPKLGKAFAGSVCQKNLCVTQCTVDADCAKLGGAFAEDVCQNNVCVAPVQDPLVCKTPDAGAAQTAKFTFTIAFTAPMPDAQPFDIVACNRLDVNCDAPVTDHVTAKAGDPIELDLPVGFQGYLQIKSDSALPAMEFLARPIVEDTAGWNLTIATKSTVTGLGLATGTKIDSSLGTVIVIARDCNRMPLAGVQTSIDVTQGTGDGGPDTTVGFYFANMFPNKSQTTTTSEGAAGYVNVPLGSALLGATIVDSGKMLSPTSAVSRGGWLSYVEVQP